MREVELRVWRVSCDATRARGMRCVSGRERLLSSKIMKRNAVK